MDDVGNLYLEAVSEDILRDVLNSGDSFVVVRNRGNTEDIHNYVLKSLYESPYWDNVKLVVSAIRDEAEPN